MAYFSNTNDIVILKESNPFEEILPSSDTFLSRIFCIDFPKEFMEEKNNTKNYLEIFI